MTRQTELAAAYEAARPRLTRVAYAVLGTVSEAEDVVSDTWLRMSAADAHDPIRDVEAWATVAVARASLDALRSARVRREVYVGPWLPEPIVDVLPVSAGGPGGSLSVDPADRVTLDDTVSFALMVVLESLTPAERTAWVLHDLFEMPFSEVAEVVGRSSQAVRQLAARARTHLSAGAPRVEVQEAEHSQAVAAFLKAASGGDLQALLATLDPDVMLTSDGAGEVTAARRPVHGADRVARFVLGGITKFTPALHIQTIRVNGALGLGSFRDGQLVGVLSVTVTGGRITRLDIISAPGKLRRFTRAASPEPIGPSRPA